MLEKPKTLFKTSSVEELRLKMKSIMSSLDSKIVLGEVQKETENFTKIKKFDRETNVYKAMTLYEFDKGILLCEALPEKYRVFALEFSKNLQSELNCVNLQEKSLAEMCSLNYVRVLEIENRITSYLGVGSITDMGVKYLDVMSKELDRAQRHYLSSLQTLRMLKLPPLVVNIKTQTAVLGQNQVIQLNNNDKAK